MYNKIPFQYFSVTADGDTLQDYFKSNARSTPKSVLNILKGIDDLLEFGYLGTCKRFCVYFLPKNEEENSSQSLLDKVVNALDSFTGGKLKEFFKQLPNSQNITLLNGAEAVERIFLDYVGAASSIAGDNGMRVQVINSLNRAIKHSKGDADFLVLLKKSLEEFGNLEEIKSFIAPSEGSQGFFEEWSKLKEKIANGGEVNIKLIGASNTSRGFVDSFLENATEEEISKTKFIVYSKLLKREEKEGKKVYRFGNYANEFLSDYRSRGINIELRKYYGDIPIGEDNIPPSLKDLSIDNPGKIEANTDLIINTSNIKEIHPVINEHSIENAFEGIIHDYSTKNGVAKTLEHKNLDFFHDRLKKRPEVLGNEKNRQKVVDFTEAWVKENVIPKLLAVLEKPKNEVLSLTGCQKIQGLVRVVVGYQDYGTKQQDGTRIPTERMKRKVIKHFGDEGYRKYFANHNENEPDMMRY